MSDTNLPIRELIPWHLLLLLLALLFAAEMVSTDVCLNLTGHLSPDVNDLLDAILLPLFFAAPLWFFCHPAPLLAKQPVPRTLPKRWLFLFLVTLGWIFVVELVAMELLFQENPPYRTDLLLLADAGIVALGSLPMLLYLVTRPELRRRRFPLATFLNRPMGLFVTILFLVFCSDLVQEMVMPIMAYQGFKISYPMLDSILSAILMAPLLWWTTVGPLKKAIHHNQSLFDALRSQLSEAMVTVNSDGTILDCNAAIEETLGFDHDQIVGKKLDTLLPREFLPRETMEQNEPGPRRPLRTGRIQRPDGSTATIEVSVNRMPRGFDTEQVILMRDITEEHAQAEALAKSEARLRQLFEQTEDAIVFFTPGTTIIQDTNSTAEILFGLQKSALVGEDMCVWIEDEDRKRVGTGLENLERRHSLNLPRVRAHSASGKHMTLSMRAKLMDMIDGPLGYCTLRDISERVRLEHETKGIQARLIETNKMSALGLMVSGVAHEINNPNNYIMVNAEILQRLTEDLLAILEQHQDKLEGETIGGLTFEQAKRELPKIAVMISEGSNQIESIVRNLKNFARNEAVPQNPETDTNKVIRAALRLVQHELSRHCHNFTMDLASNLPKIRANQQQLGQVIINLVSNAYQALPTPGHRISLSSRLQDKGHAIQIEVEDEGDGMAPELAEKILEPFFTTKLDQGGSGLGLAITQSIVKDHGWQLGFRSQPGEGTTFLLTIPLEDQ